MNWFNLSFAIAAFIIATPVHGEQVHCLERTIPVGIDTESGRPLPELNAANLNGTYENRQIAIKSVNRERERPRVILLLDTSGSMTNIADAEVHIAEGVLSQLPEDIPVGLAYFNKEMKVVALPSTDRANLILQMESLRQDARAFRGLTAIEEAINETVKMFSTPKLGDAVFLVSDGLATLNTPWRLKLDETLGRNQVRLFAFIFTSLNTRTSIAHEPSRDLVRDSGGAMFTATFPQVWSGLDVELSDKHGKRTEIGQGVAGLTRLLYDFYRVEIQLPEAVQKRTELKLRWSPADHSSKGGIFLTYPEVPLPCD